MAGKNKFNRYGRGRSTSLMDLADKNPAACLTAAVSLLISIIGVAIMVVPYHYRGSGFTSPIHLRYLMYYFPLIFVFFLSDSFSGKLEKRSGMLVCLGLITAMTIFPSAFRFFNAEAGVFNWFLTRKLWQRVRSL